MHTSSFTVTINIISLFSKPICYSLSLEQLTFWCTLTFSFVRGIQNKKKSVFALAFKGFPANATAAVIVLHYQFVGVVAELHFEEIACFIHVVILVND